MIEECLSGSLKARKKLYEQFANQMYSLSFRYARSKDDANDIFQQAFLHVYKNLNQLRNPNALSGWIKSIFINTALDYCKKNYNSHVISIEDCANNGVPNNLNKAVSNIEMGELRAIIQQLPEQYKNVFNLYVIDGFSHKEISVKLSLSIGTSKSHLFHARRLLRNEIIKHDASEVRRLKYK